MYMSPFHVKVPREQRRSQGSKEPPPPNPQPLLQHRKTKKKIGPTSVVINEQPLAPTKVLFHLQLWPQLQLLAPLSKLSSCPAPSHQTVNTLNTKLNKQSGGYIYTLYLGNSEQEGTSAKPVFNLKKIVFLGNITTFSRVNRKVSANFLVGI